MSKWRSVIALLLAAMLLVAGCGGQPGPQTGTQPGAATGAGSGATASPGAPVVFRYSISNDPTTLDPGVCSDGACVRVLRHLFDTLTIMNADSEPAPLLADGMPQVSPDGTVYTFKIVKGATFHNGREITAADFKYAWERALSPDLTNNVGGYYLDDIIGASEVMEGAAKELRGVKVIDDHTLEVTIDGPKPYFLAKLSFVAAAPLPREEVESNDGRIDENNLTKVASGPVVFKEFTQGSKLVTEKNHAYWGKPVAFDVWEVPVIKDGQSIVAAYQSGQLDMAEVPVPEIPRIKADSRLSQDYSQYTRGNTYYLALNQNIVEAFNDVRVRQAVAMAINREQLAEVVMNGLVVPAVGMLPPGMPGYNPNIRPQPFDPERARQLLAASGEDINGIKLQFQQADEQLKVAQFLQNQLKQNLGVEWVLDGMERGQHIANFRAGDKTQAYYHWWFGDYPDPQNFLYILVHQDASAGQNHGWQNAQFKDLVDRANSLPGGAERLELYSQAEQIFLDEVGGMLPLYHVTGHLLMRPNVKGLVTPLIGTISLRDLTLD